MLIDVSSFAAFIRLWYRRKQDHSYHYCYHILQKHPVIVNVYPELTNVAVYWGIQRKNNDTKPSSSTTSHPGELSCKTLGGDCRNFEKNPLQTRHIKNQLIAKYLLLFLVCTHVIRRPCWCTKEKENVARV